MVLTERSAETSKKKVEVRNIFISINGIKQMGTITGEVKDVLRQKLHFMIIHETELCGEATQCKNSTL